MRHLTTAQVTASPVASVSALSDGQPQAATSAAKVSQLTDGQPQATKATTAAAVSQPLLLLPRPRPLLLLRRYQMVRSRPLKRAVPLLRSPMDRSSKRGLLLHPLTILTNIVHQGQRCQEHHRRRGKHLCPGIYRRCHAGCRPRRVLRHRCRPPRCRYTLSAYLARIQHG